MELTTRFNLCENWTGFFQLDESYGPVLKGKKGYFEMEVKVKDGILSGVCKDTRGFGIKETRNSKITGEFKNGWLTFVKTYEKPIPIDTFGSNIQGAHFNAEVQYEGVPDHLGKTIKGKWKISLCDNPKKPEDYATGKWEMTCK